MLAHELLLIRAESEIADGMEQVKAPLEEMNQPGDQGADLAATPYGLTILVTNKDGP